MLRPVEELADPYNELLDILNSVFCSAYNLKYILEVVPRPFFKISFPVIYITYIPYAK